MPVFFYSKPMIFNVIGGFLILSCHVGQYMFLWFIVVKFYNFTVNNYKVGIYFTMFHKCKTPCRLKTGGLRVLCIFLCAAAGASGRCRCRNFSNRDPHVADCTVYTIFIQKAANTLPASLPGISDI